MNTEELFKSRLLRKIPVDILKVKGSLNTSEKKLIEANALFNANFFSHVVLSSYTSMFHSARAILYFNGVQEKSHYATYIWIKEKYSKIIPLNLLNAFNNYREDRQGILYGLSDKSSVISREDAKDSILYAKEFLKEVKKILKL